LPNEIECVLPPIGDYDLVMCDCHAAGPAKMGRNGFPKLRQTGRVAVVGQEARCALCQPSVDQSTPNPERKAVRIGATDPEIIARPIAPTTGRAGKAQQGRSSVGDGTVRSGTVNP